MIFKLRLEWQEGRGWQQEVTVVLRQGQISGVVQMKDQ